MDKIIKKYSKALDVLEKAEIFAGCVALCVFILMVAYQIVSRFTRWPSFFSEEISNTAFVWMAFLGSSVMLRRYEHYRFTGVAEKFKGAAFIINETICLAVLLIISVLMMVHGFKLVIMFKDWRFSSMDISRSLLWACMPVAGVTCTLYVIEAILKFIQNPSSRKIVSEADKLLAAEEAKLQAAAAAEENKEAAQ